MEIPPISFSNVAHGYDQRDVLTDITATLMKERITAILGKSGSGKSTLLKIINGLVRPREGRVTIFGEVLHAHNQDELRQKVGYVVQQVGLFPHLTIGENIGILGRIRHQKADAIRRRTFQLLEMVQLSPHYLTKYPYQLSGGEQQRAGICRAMFLNPPLLLMDEPFGSLDYETKRLIYKNVLSIQKHEPRTVVLVTHDWEEAVTLADQFIWIENGTIKEQGDPIRLMELKQSLFS